MGVSRIEQLIEDIYEFVESCKMQPLSSTKVVVPKDELYDLLDELRLRTPDEIKRYQKIIANRDNIIQDAEDKAATMLRQAQEQTNNLISEHEIMQQAYAQGQLIVDQASEQARQIIESAKADAAQIRTGALSYSEEMVSVVEQILQNAFDSTKSKYTGLLSTLEENLTVVKNNKKELTDQLYGVVTTEEVAATNTREDQLEDFEYDTNEYDTNEYEIEE